VAEPAQHLEPRGDERGFSSEHDHWLDFWDELLLEEDLIASRHQPQKGMVDDDDFGT